MITALDEMLWHQLPTTMDHVGTSDPRFFDRFWFATYSPDGKAALQVTIGVYRNMNVIDGGVSLIIGDTQHNMRVSTSLDASGEMSCGPIRVEVVRALEHLRIHLSGEQGRIVGEIDWFAIAAPVEEAPHFQRKRGRVVEEYCRYNQIGRASGWIEVDDVRHAIGDWWGCRDHSWGVRPRIGIREPKTGITPKLADQGFTMAFLFFSTEKVAGTLLFMQREGETAYTSGALEHLETGALEEIAQVRLEPVLEADARRFRSVRVDASLEDGTSLTIDCESSGAAFALKGLGYSGGYDDCLGLGVWRGDDHLEEDSWDVSHPSEIRYPDGGTDHHWHRIQPVTLTASVAGESGRGQGSMTLILSGSIARLGLA